MRLPSLHDEPVSDLTDAEFAAFSLFALTQRPKGCFFCQADDHVLSACTKFQALKADPFASKIVCRFLDPNPRPRAPPSQSSSSSRPSKFSSPSPTHRLRQLGMDTSDTSPSSEEGYSSSTTDDDPNDELLDFREGR